MSDDFNWTNRLKIVQTETNSIPLPYMYMLVTCTSIIKIGDANLVLRAETSQWNDNVKKVFFTSDNANYQT
jgi:hypothetical protein